MPTQILMPALSPTMIEGNLARWLKKEGDNVKAGQVIAEIETDKATMEVEAVDEGTLLKILVPGGSQGIKVNTPIAILADEGEVNMTVDAALAVLAKKTSMAADKGSMTSASTVPGQSTKAPSSPQALASGGKKIVASPLARRLAEQKGIDLRSIIGTGPHGRIIKVDVENLGHKSMTGMSQSPPSPSAAPGIDARDYADKLGMSYQKISNNTVRKTIAKRLTESKQTVPHFYLTIECEIDELLSLRKSINEISNTKISVNDCIIRAVALALKKVPTANVSWTNDAILQYESIDVSVAVATANGLVTPIIKKTDTKSLAQIASEMKDLASRARDGKLRPEEFLGGGFTISNLGMFGIKSFSAIINPPQSCILAIGAGEQRPIVKNGQIGIATVMTCTLSVDHRSVDGSVGAEFLAAFKPLIEKPYSLVV
jgi:pyruvate dehydrogenase E2 component (dihydrolipoamide acetyltransferase)